MIFFEKRHWHTTQCVVSYGYKEKNHKILEGNNIKIFKLVNSETGEYKFVNSAQIERGE